MIQELCNQQIRLQGSQDEQRNAAVKLTNMVARGLALNPARESIDPKQIEGGIPRKGYCK